MYFNALILAGGVAKNGSYPLLSKVGSCLLVDHYINKLRAANCDEIYIVGGPKIDELQNKIDEKIILIDNTSNILANTGSSISVALKQIPEQNTLIMHGDLFFERNAVTKITSKQDSIVTSPFIKKKEIGCIIMDGRVSSFSWSSKYKWGQMCYLSKGSIAVMKRISDRIVKPNGYFSFEFLDMLIKEDISIHVFHDEVIIDLDSIKDYKLCKDYLDEVILCSKR